MNAMMSRRVGSLMGSDAIQALGDKRQAFVAEIERSETMDDLSAETKALVLSAEKELLGKGWHWDGVRMINGPVEPTAKPKLIVRGKLRP